MSWTGELISARRNALGLTQAQLAERVGASLRAVTSWEANDSQPQKKFRAELDRVLGPPMVAGADPTRPVDPSRLSNSQIVALMAEIAAEVGYRLESAPEEGRPDQRRPLPASARGGRYYPADVPEGAGMAVAQWDATAYGGGGEESNPGRRA